MSPGAGTRIRAPASLRAITIREHVLRCNVELIHHPKPAQRHYYYQFFMLSSDTQAHTNAAPRGRPTVRRAAAAAARRAEARCERTNTCTFGNFRYFQPYGANFSSARREVVFYNRAYARLGAKRDNEGQFAAAGLYETMDIYMSAPSAIARRATYLNARAKIDARLVAAFAGYTVLFAHDDPDRVVPSGLVGHVETRVCGAETARHGSFWNAWTGSDAAAAPAPAQ